MTLLQLIQSYSARCR